MKTVGAVTESLAGRMITTTQPRSAGSSATVVCPRCLGKGFLAFDVPPGDARFGRVVPCACTLAKQRSGMFQGALAGMTLASFKPVTEDEKTALLAARALARKWQGGAAQSIVFYAALVDETREFPGLGVRAVTGCGCGKTHLAVSLAKAALEVGRDVALVTETELLRRIKQSYGDDTAPSEGAILAELARAWLLVWDDVGTAGVKSAAWYQDIGYAVVNGRYQAGLPLVLTSNLPPAELQERLGTRTWSRLNAMAEFFRLDGPDRRVLR